MTPMTPSTSLVTIQPTFTESERLALAGFLAGYRGLTREAYTLDLRQFTAWCRARHDVGNVIGPTPESAGFGSPLPQVGGPPGRAWIKSWTADW
jgi:hypothetical protein